MGLKSPCIRLVFWTFVCLKHDTSQAKVPRKAQFPESCFFFTGARLIRSFVHLFIRSRICAVIPSSIRSFVHLSIRSFIHSFVHSVVYSFGQHLRLSKKPQPKRSLTNQAPTKINFFRNISFLKKIYKKSRTHH